MEVASSSSQIWPVSLPLSITREKWVIHAHADLFYIILSPVLGILLASLFYSFSGYQSILSRRELVGTLLSSILIQSHIVLVFARSHLNPHICRQHPLQFRIVPILLFLAMLSWNEVLIALAVLGELWDIYHSGMQTFGFARIYDKREGNDARVGRRLDIVLCQLMYAGAIIAGLNLVPYAVRIIRSAEKMDADWSPLLKTLSEAAPSLSRLYLVTVFLYLLFYCFNYYRFYQRGYRFSPLKIAFLAVTGIVSVYSWVKLPFLVALFVANFYHAVQYFAMVWHTEKKHLELTFKKHLKTPTLLFTVFLFTAVFYGLLINLPGRVIPIPVSVAKVLYSFALTCSLLHYWYDGFIWSVRKDQV